MNKIANKVLIDPGEVMYTLFNVRPIILSYPGPHGSLPRTVRQLGGAGEIHRSDPSSEGMVQASVPTEQQFCWRAEFRDQNGS